MKKNLKFSLIGGDKRFIYLANILNEEGFEINTYGLETDELYYGIQKKKSITDVIENADVIICPVPCSLDGETVNCKYFDENIYLEEIFKNMNNSQLFLAGYIEDNIMQLANTYNISACDYLQREELAVLNCIPTAEGAIQVAMEELPYTIHNSDFLILGFGRIGKILSNMLHALGANVYVGARKHSDLAWIEAYGYKGIHLNNLKNNLGKFNTIFNTIPSKILDKEILEKVEKDCVIIELASKPWGVDFEAANQLGLRVNFAQSLPGKVAPYTAAQIIKDTMHNILNDMEV